MKVADLTAFNQHDTYLWHHTHTVGLTSQEGEGEAYWDKLEGIADQSIPTQKTRNYWKLILLNRLPNCKNPSSKKIKYDKDTDTKQATLLGTFNKEALRLHKTHHCLDWKHIN